jgi:hypothetical protein
LKSLTVQSAADGAAALSSLMTVAPLNGDAAHTVVSEASAAVSPNSSCW